jgi:hypothetical protein
LAPIVLGFIVIMARSIAGMLKVMRQRGLDASLVVAATIAAVGAVSALILVLLLRGIRPRRLPNLA